MVENNKADHKDLRINCIETFYMNQWRLELTQYLIKLI